MGDQKTVCRRETQLAQKREEALLQQFQQTIDRYNHVLEVSRALTESARGEEGSFAGNRDTEVISPGLSPELVVRYEERIQLLRGAVEQLLAEPSVSLPRLTPLEQAKGFVFSSYAQTARSANKLKAAPALGGARTALASF